MQIGSIPPTYCGSFLHTLIFPCRGSSLPFETAAYVAAVTPLLDNEQGEHAAADGSRALPLREAPRFVERGAHRDGHSVAFETLQHDHDVDVLMAYGRCLRPALYSSLRSSPSHPTGVSALRVTIAIANARFARKQWGASQVNCQSRGGSFAMKRPPADAFGHAPLDDPPQ
jgi:hypothetical protein